MSSGGYPSPSERKQYTEEEQKLVNFMRQYRSQPIKDDQYVNDPLHVQEMIVHAPSEIVHIPPKYQQFQATLDLDLPHAAATIIRHSPSTIRTLVQANTGQYYIEHHAQNSSNTASNRQDTSLQSNSTSTWPV